LSKKVRIYQFYSFYPYDISDVFEFSKGKYSFAETDKSAEYISENLYKTTSGYDCRDLTIDDLKNMYAQFFNVDEFKDLIYEFLSSKEIS
jgi:hypothetical protein